MKIRYIIPKIRKVYIPTHDNSDFTIARRQTGFEVILEKENNDVSFPLQEGQTINIYDKEYIIRKVVYDANGNLVYVTLDEEIVEEDIESIKETFQKVINYWKGKAENLETDLKFLREDFDSFKENVKKNYRRKWFRFKKRGEK